MAVDDAFVIINKPSGLLSVPGRGPDKQDCLICDWPNRPRQMVDHTIGKPATTHFTVLARDALAQRTRVGLTPITGRSHQLRVHLASLGHSIVGDSLYAEAPPAAGERLMLHASRLGFPHPVTGELREFSSAVPF